jgi:hypothetical protein
MDGGHIAARGLGLAGKSCSIAGARVEAYRVGESLEGKIEPVLHCCQKSKSRSPSEWKLAATTTTRQEDHHRSKVVDKAGGVKHTIGVQSSPAMHCVRSP